LEELALPSVGASFKKWGCYTPILSKALAHHPNFQKFFFFKQKISKKFELSHRSSAGRGSTPAPVGQFPFFLNFFFFLPSTFCATGQLLLVGSSTCPPCPDFSLKLQTPITFDP
jgi:hypothetical protein